MKEYLPYLTASVNNKGVLDVDVVKGCEYGMKKYPNGGCYGLCYANRLARARGFDFTKSISRKINNINAPVLFNYPGINGEKSIINKVKNHSLKWFRIGTFGDPSHDWNLTLEVCEWLCCFKVPVIITKHWIEVPEYILGRFKKTNAVFNTSTSPLDSKREIAYRIKQFKKLNEFGIKSVLRIVTCKFGNTKTGRKLNSIQDYLLKFYPIIDNPLRIPSNNKMVLDGTIIVNCNGISLYNKKTYLGHCSTCPDQCGLEVNGE